MKRIIFIAAALVCLYSCKKEVNLNLNDAGPHIVIQGEVTDELGPYMVRVNYSVGFDKTNDFPPISGAQVRITDGEGHTDTLTETLPGAYFTNTILGKPGNTYSLSVFANDTLYTATSTMPQRVNLDSVTFNETQIFNDKTIYAVPNFQDPAGVANYYQFMEYLNGKLLNKRVFVFDDRLSDGRYITRTLRNDSAYMKPFDLLELRMNCIDKPVYDYFNQLDQSSDGFSSASPANPASNISNGALGYFSAHTSSIIKTQVK